MYVVATAGHVDHGKSALVRALTGMEPDRWAEERRRGLTIDLGFAWTVLPSGREVALVDVPGHERFLGNMLAGLGPAPVVCFVVAADEGWQAQSADHRDAVAALGIEHGVLVISRVDRAPDRVAEVTARAREELAGTGLRDAPSVAVSAVDGTGIEELRTVLDGVLGATVSPPADGRVRLWVDRAFSITGAGTVVTGTLAAGTVAVGDRLQLLGRDGTQSVVVRGLQSRGESHRSRGPVDRVGVNLRGIAADELHRGDALVTPDAWPLTDVIDVRRTTGAGYPELPATLNLHVGTAAGTAHLRAFDDDHARLHLERPLPLVIGDRLVLRGPGSRGVLGGAVVLDADPPALRRRGAAARWGAELATRPVAGDLRAEVRRRGVVEAAELRRLGLLGSDDVAPEGVRVVGKWWVDTATYDDWRRRLGALVAADHEQDALTAGLSAGAARSRLDLPDAALLASLAADAGVEIEGGRIRLPGTGGLGAAEPRVVELERRLAAAPFRAPESDDLAELGLGVRELAVAERAGRVLRLPDGVVLLPTAPAQAMRVLAGLPQPFTTSEARQALGTTRRVVIPLLTHLDNRGWTRRIDAGHREVVR